MFNAFYGWSEHPRRYPEMADGNPTGEGKPARLKVAAARALFKEMSHKRRHDSTT